MRRVDSTIASSRPARDSLVDTSISHSLVSRMNEIIGGTRDFLTGGRGMTRAQTALVVGGGIAGPVAAIALRRAGIEATAYEAYDRQADGIGGELMLAPNGMAALASAGIADRVAAAGVPTPRMVMETGTGRR